jgi:DNA segregation ATPase FtsK/SpoIIIE, S-DNA-T family
MLTPKGIDPMPSGFMAYELPSLNLLTRNSAQSGLLRSPDALAEDARNLETVLDGFGIKGQVVKVSPGPLVTRHDLELALGTKHASVFKLAGEIAQSMRVHFVRVISLPRSNLVGIEVPNHDPETILLRQVLEGAAEQGSSEQPTFVLGMDTTGHIVEIAMDDVKHVMVVGPHGSGKTMLIDAIILSLLCRQPPDACQMIAISPNILEMSAYNKATHLRAPAVDDSNDALNLLVWATGEVGKRCRLMLDQSARHFTDYNRLLSERPPIYDRILAGYDLETGKPLYVEVEQKPLPRILIIIDDLSYLFRITDGKCGVHVLRILQQGAAVGVHLVASAVSLSSECFPGLIVEGFPSYATFRNHARLIHGLPSHQSERLGQLFHAAGHLFEQRDMLFMSADGCVTRIHSPYVPNDDIYKVVGHLSTQAKPVHFDAIINEDTDRSHNLDELYDQAVALVVSEGHASTSLIQHRFQIGYNRAARIIEAMEAHGVISPPNKEGKRSVFGAGAGGWDL